MCGSIMEFMHRLQRSLLISHRPHYYKSSLIKELVSKLIENALFNTNIIKAFIYEARLLKRTSTDVHCSNIARDEMDPGYDLLQRAGIFKLRRFQEN